MRSGFIAILGKPNVGKSTLLNALLSKKVSIVTPRAQTTRDSIMGILTEKDYQMVFVDTPGIFFGKQRLDKIMRKSAFESARDVNLILYLIDASTRNIEDDIRIFDSIHSESPRVFVINKIDLIRPEKAMKLKEKLREFHPDTPIIEASFIENFGIKEIKEAVLPYLEEGPFFFPEDSLTDKDKAYQAKEAIREVMLKFLRDEIPHQSAVFIESIKEKEGEITLNATIVTERDAHKGIVIGKGGEMIKKIRLGASKELARMWHLSVEMNLKVIVDPSWRDNPGKLSRYGYGES